MRKEIEFLLSCVRDSAEANREEIEKTLRSQSFDWTYLIDTADIHGLMPLLYRKLRTSYSQNVPKDILDDLRQHFHHNSWQNALKTEELSRLLGLFSAHKIPAVVYKGPVLAAFAYGNLSLRQFGDLDILFHERDIQKVKELLLQQGYTPELQLNSSQEKIYNRFQRDLNFTSDDGKVAVEIQWDIPPRYFPFSFTLDSLRERIQTVSLENKEFFTFSPEDTLIILCIHGLYHCWERAGWICDVAKLIEAYPIMNWEFVLSQAEALKSEQSLYLGLCLVQDLFKTPYPKNIRERMREDNVSRAIASKIQDNLFSEKEDLSRPIKCVFSQIRTWKRLRDKVFFCFHLAVNPNPEDWKLLKLPSLFSFLYALIRPIRLLFTYGWRTVK
jgi:hypothetical protein